MSVRHSNKKRKNVARSRVSRLLQTVSRYISRDKYRDSSMNRDDTISRTGQNGTHHARRQFREGFLLTE